MKLNIFMLLLFFSSIASGALQTATSKIDTLSTYSTFGNGDVVFQLDVQITECEGGFWLRESDPGFKSNLSLLLSAFHADTKLSLAAHTDQLWNGAATKYCRIDWLKLRKE